LCGSEENNVLARTSISPFGTISNLVKCRKCGLAYFNQRHSLQEELEFYRSKYQETYGEEFWYKSRIDFFRTALDRIESFNVSKGSLLDVGCGMGFFLKEAKDRGWKRTLGVEVSRLAIDHVNRKLGVEVREGDLREVNFPENYFDVATAWNVIDQLQEPLETLREMHRVLKKDGLIALRVSNLNFHLLIHRLSNLLERLGFKRISLRTHGCFHIYAFSPASISFALQRAGYVKIKVYNSPIEGGTPARSKLDHAIRKLAFGLAEGAFYLTGGTFVISPSLLVFAQKAVSGLS
jgi:SAM-dependent methyltransferase